MYVCMCVCVYIIVFLYNFTSQRNALNMITKNLKFTRLVCNKFFVKFYETVLKKYADCIHI